jgi:hypothetical protein
MEINLDNYNPQFNDDGTILLVPKFITVKYDELENYDFAFSNIINCKIKNKNLNKLKFNSILYDIYCEIDDGTTIIKKAIVI